MRNNLEDTMTPSIKTMLIALGFIALLLVLGFLGILDTSLSVG